MEYSKARSIRSQKLSSLIADKIAEGGSISGSIGKSISEKLKARATGIQEKFDPLNFARFITGGSKLAPAVLGRITGRSKSSIKYFTQTGSSTAKKLGKLSKESGEYGVDSEKLAQNLNSIYNLLRTSRERDIKLREIERSFQEEKINEDERRHQEFLGALREFFGPTKKTATAVVEEAEAGGGLFSTLKTIYDKVKSEIDDVVKKIKDYIDGFEIFKNPLQWFGGTLLRFLGSNLFRTFGIAGVLGALLIAEWKLELSKLQELAGTKAAELGAQRQTEEMLGAMSADDPSQLPSAIMGAAEGVETTSDKILKEIRVVQETKASLMQDKGYTPTYVDGFGRWHFADKDGNEPSAELMKSTEQQAVKLVDSGSPIAYTGAQKPLPYYRGNERLGQMRQEAAGADPRRLDLPTQAAFGVYPKAFSAKPVEPKATPVFDLSSMNADLNTEYTVMGDAAAPTVINSNTSNNTKDKPLPVAPTVRDNTRTIERTFQQTRMMW